MPIALTAEVDAAIRAHGRETFPHECCGAMLGKDGVVREAFKLPNTTEEGPRPPHQDEPGKNGHGRPPFLRPDDPQSPNGV